MHRKGRTPPNKNKKYPPEVLTDDEVHALIGQCSARTPTGLRNRALMAVLYRAGLRISEALALRPKDLDSEAGTVRVLVGKGKRDRTVGMDAGAFAVVARWLGVRAHLGIDAARGAPLFCTLAGRPLLASYVRTMLPRLARGAGIPKRVHPHGLRHTHAAQLAREGVPLNVIQAQLGHSNIATTSHYLQHVAPQQLIRVMKGRAWDGSVADEGSEPKLYR